MPLPEVFRAKCRRPAPPRSRARVVGGLFPRPFRLDARGLYRIFKAPEYRFYRSNGAPPTEAWAPFATSSSLPTTPTAAFDDGTWYLACSYFNGVIDSGFLPLGPAGETYLRLDIAGGTATGAPPLAPLDVRLGAAAGGVVRVMGLYYHDDADRATQWAIAYTADGADPPADAPDLVEDMPEAGLAMLDYALPAAADGATVKVRLQTRRNDGDDESPAWVYSAGSTVLSIAAEAAGPSAPLAGDRWPGQMLTEHD